jgi:[ribosomal protein S5]-alanine N-acetyltransferase
MMNECNCIFETARLNLRPMQSGDVGVIHQISNEPGVYKYLFDDKPSASDFIQGIYEQSVINFESRRFGVWILLEKRTDTIVGFCGLRIVEVLSETEIFYALGESKWHFGYAIEAASVVARYAFEHARVERLIGITDAPNVGSWRVLEKLRMRECPPANADEHFRYASITHREFLSRGSGFSL